MITSHPADGGRQRTSETQEAIGMLRPLKILHDYVVAYTLLTLLGAICLLFSVWALLMYPLLPREVGTAAGRFGIMAGFRLFAWLLTASGAYKLDLSALDSLRDGPPVILAPNHPSLIDALLILTRHPNIACVLKAELMNNLFLGAGSRLARYIPSDQPRQMIKDAVADLQQGACCLLFPEGTRTTRAIPVESTQSEYRLDREACARAGSGRDHRNGLSAYSGYKGYGRCSAGPSYLSHTGSDSGGASSHPPTSTGFS